MFLSPAIQAGAGKTHATRLPVQPGLPRQKRLGESAPDQRVYVACLCYPSCPARLIRALPQRLARGPRQIPPRQRCLPHGSRRSPLLPRRRTLAPQGQRSRDGSDSLPNVQHPLCLPRRVDGPARPAVRPRGVHWRDLSHGAVAKRVRFDRQGCRRGRKWCVRSGFPDPRIELEKS